MKRDLFQAAAGTAAVLLTATVACGAVPYTDDLGFNARSTAKPPRLTVSPRPSQAIKNPVVIDGKKVYRIPGPEKGKQFVGYTSTVGMVGRNSSAPGTMVITTEGNLNGDVSSIKYALNYIRKGGGNGSAGSESHSVAAKAGYIGQSMAFTVPPEAIGIQYIFGFNGKPGSSWDISRLTFEFAPDNVKLKKIMPPYGSKPSTWGSKYSASADCFFNVDNAKVAEARTSVKIAYDDKNLYLGYVCSEPEMKVLASKITERDGSVWQDDCVEFFFFDPEKDVVKQFITNPIGTMFDAELAQAQAGDPYKIRPWDGKWSVKTYPKTANTWEVAMILPWKTLGFDGVPAYPVTVNFGRERHADKVVSHWNSYQGNLNEVNNFAKMDFVKNELVRNRKIEKVNYIPKRAKKLYKELLTNEKNNWLSFIWSSEYYLIYQAPAVRAKNTLESIVPHQKKMLKAYGEAGMAGPGLPYVWAKHNTLLTRADYEEAYKLYGTKFTQTVRFSEAVAKKEGAKPTTLIGTRLAADPGDPVAIELTKKHLDNIAAGLAKDPEKRKFIAYLHGIDEPTNPISYIYSRTRNSENVADIDAVAEEIKAKYGFGKYTMDDRFGDAGPARHFDRIAFWRWWNDRFANYTKTLSEHAAKVLPGIPYQVFNRNTCAGTDTVDVALCANGDFYISSDPYPTSSRSYFGMGRALYHTGYSVKLMRDLAPKAKIGFFGQAFNYCGGTPVRADLREWASQALKNGLDQFTWYAQDALHVNPEIFNEAFEISRQVKDMPKLKFPSTTKTAIYYSDYDRWGLNEGGTHPTYTVYALLGEHLGSWFRFVSKNHLDLNGIKQLYIPRMRYSDPDLTKKVLDFARNGGTLIVFDPTFLTYNIDGSSIAERAEVVGTELVKKNGVSMSLKYGKVSLPLTRVMHTSSEENTTVQAFDFAKVPAGAKVLATYTDGKPAIIERAFGKGKVIFSAVQPFGISDAAIEPAGWKNFVADRAKAVGEKTNLDIWYFQLPEVKNKHFNIVGLK